MLMSEAGTARQSALAPCTLSYYAACSLDGFIATPDGGVDWLPPIDPDGEDFGFGEFFAGVDAIVMGRYTYEQSLSLSASAAGMKDTGRAEAGDWAYGDTPCWVMSHHPLNPPRSSIRVSAAGRTQS